MEFQETIMLLCYYLLIAQEKSSIQSVMLILYSDFLSNEYTQGYGFELDGPSVTRSTYISSYRSIVTSKCNGAFGNLRL